MGGIVSGKYRLVEGDQLLFRQQLWQTLVPFVRSDLYAVSEKEW